MYALPGNCAGGVGDHHILTMYVWTIFICVFFFLITFYLMHRLLQLLTNIYFWFLLLSYTSCRQYTSWSFFVQAYVLFVLNVCTGTEWIRRLIITRYGVILSYVQFYYTYYKLRHHFLLSQPRRSRWFFTNYSCS